MEIDLSRATLRLSELFAARVADMMGSKLADVASADEVLSTKDRCPTKGYIDSPGLMQSCYESLFGAPDMQDPATIDRMCQAWARVRLYGFETKLPSVRVH